MIPEQNSSSVSRADLASALWLEAAGVCAIRHEPLGAPGPDEVRVRMLYSGVSRGTERLVFEGKVPVSEYERMRGPNMQGDFPFPIKYGYAAVGEVEAGRPELIGKQVFSLHPHQDVFVISADQTTVLPEGVPARRAILGANIETALNIVWDAGILPGDKVAVFGAGVVGVLTAFIASRIIGTETTLVDLDTDRRRLASDLSIDFTTPEALSGDYDVLINASGSGAALTTALSHAGMEARIVEASWHGDSKVELSLGGAFHSKRLRIISSQVGRVPADRSARWPFSRRLEKALQLLADPALDALISGETPFSELEATYPHILAAQDTLCHCIRY